MDSTTVILVVAAIVVIGVVVAIVASVSRRDRLRKLPEETRRRYADSWRTIEARFIEDPAAAVAEADRLCVSILTERGARLDDRRKQPRELAAARADARSEQGRQGTEGMRNSMLHYQAIVDDAVGESLRKQATRRPEVA
jgi:hypothetical protein